MIRRRTVVLGAAAAALALPTMVPAAAPTNHPDAQLLQLWDNLGAAWRKIEALSEDATDEDAEPFWQAHDRVRDEIEATMPLTMAGMAVRLKLALIGLSQSQDVTPITNFRRPMPEDEDADLAALWRMVEFIDSRASVA